MIFHLDLTKFTANFNSTALIPFNLFWHHSLINYMLCVLINQYWNQIEWKWWQRWDHCPAHCPENSTQKVNSSQPEEKAETLANDTHRRAIWHCNWIKLNCREPSHLMTTSKGMLTWSVLWYSLQGHHLQTLPHQMSGVRCPNCWTEPQWAKVARASWYFQGIRPLTSSAAIRSISCTCVNGTGSSTTS